MAEAHTKTRVAVVGAGMAGLTAALRLSQRGYRVTLFETRDYIGGKLGAHRGELFHFGCPGIPLKLVPAAVHQASEAIVAELDAGRFDPRGVLAELFRDNGRELAAPVAIEATAPGSEWILSDTGGSRRHVVRRPCSCSAADGRHATLRIYDGDAFHEHCYHMYLNWYHNFWRLVGDPVDGLGMELRDHFAPSDRISLLRAGEFPRFRALKNSGSLRSSVGNLLSGVEPVPDMFLWSYALLDLLSQPFDRGDLLSRYTVTGFLHSRFYSTGRSAELYDDTIAKAFAARADLSSASSYQSFLKYGFRHPEPQMWLLKGNTHAQLFSRFEDKLREQGCEVVRLRRVDRVLLRRAQDGSHRVKAIVTACTESAPQDPGSLQYIDEGFGRQAVEVDALVLAVPPRVLARLILDPEGQSGPQKWGAAMASAPDKASSADDASDASIAQIVPELTGVRHLHTEAMVSVDLYLRKRLVGIPAGVVVLRDAKFDLTFVDQSLAWTDGSLPAPDECTMLNVVATDYRAIPAIDATVQGFAVIEELQRFLPGFDAGGFWGDPDSDIDWDRSFVRLDAEGALFVNQAGSEMYRPTSNYPAMRNLFIAGEFCDTMIDVATIEGAVVSGLMAARALQDLVPLGKPIEIISPQAYPQLTMVALKYLLAPTAYAAKTWSMAYDALALLEGRKQGDRARLASDVTSLVLAPWTLAEDLWRSVYGLARRRK